MRLSPALQIAGLVNLLLGAALVVPLALSVYYGDGQMLTFVFSIILSGAVGAILVSIFKGSCKDISHREGFLLVAAAWLNAGFFCAVPFILSGFFPSFVDAIFEGVSGITTTGASILPNVEALPPSLIFWRSLTHWLGGVGIVVLSLAILPLLGVGGMQLFKAEASVISSDKFAPRVREMARSILAVYLVLSVSEVVLLKLAGLSLFDAVIHMFGTVGTAGFSSNAQSVGHYDSVFVEAIVVVFMILGATNFALHFRLLREGAGVYKKSAEFKFFLLLILAASILVAVNINGPVYSGILESLRYAVFQVVSIVTTTGFSSADYGSWPAFSQVVIIALMFVGGMVGSTTGSIKCVRILLLVRYSYKEIYRLIHPHAVIKLKAGGKPVSDEVIRSVFGFTVLFVLVFVVSAIALSATGVDPYSSIASAAATITNVGPGLGITGPASSYATIPEPGKWILILNMILGRLEIYTLIILFVPAFWRG